MSFAGRVRRRLAGAALLGWLALVALPGLASAAPPENAPPPGPPYPPPVAGVYVYDYAGVFSADTIAGATRTIATIRERVGAEIAVYTQVKPGATTESTVQDANDLIDEWGVGRAGFDDGLAILFNLDASLCHGQVQLYGAPGYAATYLSNSERQQIFEDDMKPYLQACDFNGALLVALARIDANATPGHASALAAARILDAALGLVGAPLLFLLLVGMAARSWLLYGRDPVYLDDPSILMPAPPPHLTAASGAVVWEGRTSRRALTTAMIDLASRGELAFRTEPRPLLGDRIGVELGGVVNPYTERNRRRPLSAAEGHALTSLRQLAAKGAEPNYISADEMPGFGEHVDDFNKRLEDHVTKLSWFREPPTRAVSRWRGRGAVALVLGFVAVGIAASLPSGGLLLIGISLIAAGVGVMIVARAMPARTMAGAMVWAMLAAYRRTLQKTMAQARSMTEVVQRAGLPWLETPDQAAVWGVALGLQREVQEVIERSVRDAETGETAHYPWLPGWYTSTAVAGGAGVSRSGGIAPGLMSASAVPNFGGMMAALASVGNSPSSSSSGGGFSGGGGGGGGGGAGGGF